MFIPGKFNDTLVRNAVIDFFKRKFKIDLIHNPINNKIDLVCVNDDELGVEVEHGKWVGNFWNNENYSYISEQKFQTINIPARKEKYWLNEYTSYNKIRQNPSAEKNIFVRSNADFSQFIVIRPETVRDNKKLVRTKFKPNNTNEVEDWLSFRKEHVETYNLRNGKFIKQQNHARRKSSH